MEEKSNLNLHRRQGAPPVDISIPPFSRLKHLFVGDVPLLYPEKNVAKQMQVEIWFGTITLILEDLKEIVKVNEDLWKKMDKKWNEAMRYVV